MIEPDVVSFLSAQLSDRATENGDQELIAQRLQMFLELERQKKLGSQLGSNVINLPAQGHLRSIS